MASTEAFKSIGEKEQLFFIFIIDVTLENEKGEQEYRGVGVNSMKTCVCNSDE